MMFNLSLSLFDKQNHPYISTPLNIEYNKTRESLFVLRGLSPQGSLRDLLRENVAFFFFFIFITSFFITQASSKKGKRGLSDKVIVTLAREILEVSIF